MSLRDFLEGHARAETALADAIAHGDAFLRYAEDQNDDALTDAWLEKRTSYIWRVGTLAVIDSNKRDWAILFVGHEREPGKLELIGRLNYVDGENDDPGRSLQRIALCAAQADIVFEAD